MVKLEEVEPEPEEQKPAPLGNGGKTDKYVWTQTLQEVQINIPVTFDLRGKDCEVKISSETLFVKTGVTVLINGRPPKPIIASNSSWTLETDERTKNRTLTLFLSKKNRMEWWDCALQGDEKIDTKTIRPENSEVSDLDPETERIVRKMMVFPKNYFRKHDNQMKLMGKPTSDDERKNEMLKKFAEAHPEMDFSNAKIS